MPNVLLYMADEHNPLFSTPYGHPDVQTPNMTRLAERGVVFEHAYCPSPLCTPSRSAFMSGRPVHEIQVYNNCAVFKFDYPGYGGVLARQGVHTVYVGRMQVYAPASSLGFRELYFATDRPGNGDTSICRQPLAIRQGAQSRADGYGPRPQAFSQPNSRIDAAVGWLRETAPSLDSPWTLTVNTRSPKPPFYVTPDLWAAYADRGDLPPYGPDAPSARHPYAQDLRAHFQTEGFTEEQVRGMRRGYLGCVTYVDRELGRLLEALDASGQAKQTVVVYTADHGEMLGKFGMWWKGSLHEDSVRVPLIVAGPGFSPGTRVQTPVSLLDLQAAIFTATGRERPSHWWGTPLQDIPPDDPARAVFSEYHGHGVRAGAFMVRQADWKLMYNMAAPHQLYDLGSDPDELCNLADAKPDRLKELETVLRSICSPEEEQERAEAFIRRQLEAVAQAQKTS